MLEAKGTGSFHSQSPKEAELQTAMQVCLPELEVLSACQEMMKKDLCYGMDVELLFMQIFSSVIVLRSPL